MCEFNKGDKVLVASESALVGEVISTEIKVRFPGHYANLLGRKRYTEVTVSSLLVRKVGPCTATFSLNGKTITCQKEAYHERASNNLDHQAKEGTTTVSWQ
jgi:hypothetical protein